MQRVVKPERYSARSLCVIMCGGCDTKIVLHRLGFLCAARMYYRMCIDELDLLLNVVVCVKSAST